jgi:peptidoglycan/LPS O-acetylase OafA/YrhL
MHIFVLIAVLMTVGHLVAAAQRPRLAVFISAALWGLYAVYEYFVATGVLCEKDCNIRVDLVFFLPILALATRCAYQAYNGRPGQAKIIVAVLGVIALLALGVLIESRGYGYLGIALFLVGTLTILLYVVKSSKPRRTPTAG